MTLSNSLKNIIPPSPPAFPSGKGRWGATILQNGDPNPGVHVTADFDTFTNLYTIKGVNYNGAGVYELTRDGVWQVRACLTLNFAVGITGFEVNMLRNASLISQKVLPMTNLSTPTFSCELQAMFDGFVGDQIEVTWASTGAGNSTLTGNQQFSFIEFVELQPYTVLAKGLHAFLHALKKRIHTRPSRNSLP